MTVGKVKFNSIEVKVLDVVPYALDAMASDAKPRATSQAANAIVNDRHHEFKCDVNPRCLRSLC